MILSLSPYIRWGGLFLLFCCLCLLVQAGHATSCPKAANKWECLPSKAFEACKLNYSSYVYICHFEEGEIQPFCKPSLPENYSFPMVEERPKVCLKLKNEEFKKTQPSARSKTKPTFPPPEGDVKPITATFFCYNKSNLWRKDAHLKALAICYKFAEPKITKLTVIGHTDIRGGKKYNENLSNRRARNVRNYLKKTMSKTGTEIKILPKGESAPKRHGNSIKDHALNRRVEISTPYNETIRGHMEKLSIYEIEGQKLEKIVESSETFKLPELGINSLRLLQSELFQGPTRSWSTSKEVNPQNNLVEMMPESEKLENISKLIELANECADHLNGIEKNGQSDVFETEERLCLER